MTPALVAAATGAPLLRPEPWSTVAQQQASSADGALHCSTAPNECKHSARASTGSRWPTEEVHARTLWPCTADGGGLSSVSAEPAALHSRSGTFSSAPCTTYAWCHRDACRRPTTRAQPARSTATTRVTPAGSRAPSSVIRGANGKRHGRRPCSVGPKIAEKLTSRRFHCLSAVARWVRKC